MTLGEIPNLPRNTGAAASIVGYIHCFTVPDWKKCRIRNRLSHGPEAWISHCEDALTVHCPSPPDSDRRRICPYRPSVAVSRFRSIPARITGVAKLKIWQSRQQVFPLRRGEKCWAWDEDSFIPRASSSRIMPCEHLGLPSNRAQILFADGSNRYSSARGTPPPVLNFGFGDLVAILAYSFACEVTMPGCLLSLRQPHGTRD